MAKRLTTTQKKSKVRRARSRKALQARRYDKQRLALAQFVVRCGHEDNYEAFAVKKYGEKEFERSLIINDSRAEYD